MSTLVLLLDGPFQSWGVRSASDRFRDTNLFPTRSGLVGLLAACQGLDRTVSPAWAEQLEITVRADRPGHLLSDFHTAGGGYPAGRGMRTAGDKARSDAHVSVRKYLNDAAFVVAVSGPAGLVERLEAALRTPEYTPFLGRKSCPAAMPLLLAASGEPGREVLGRVPLYRRSSRKRKGVGGGGSSGLANLLGQHVSFDAMAVEAGAQEHETATIYIERPQYAVASLNDVPVSYDHWHRTHGARAIGAEEVTLPLAGTGIAGVVAIRGAIGAYRQESR